MINLSVLILFANFAYSIYSLCGETFSLTERSLEFLKYSVIRESRLIDQTKDYEMHKVYLYRKDIVDKAELEFRESNDRKAEIFILTYLTNTDKDYVDQIYASLQLKDEILKHNILSELPKTLLCNIYMGKDKFVITEFKDNDLNYYLDSVELNVSKLLQISSKLVDAIYKVHNKGIALCGVESKTIIYNDVSKSLWFNDFNKLKAKIPPKIKNDQLSSLKEINNSTSENDQYLLTDSMDKETLECYEKDIESIFKIIDSLFKKYTKKFENLDIGLWELKTHMIRNFSFDTFKIVSYKDEEIKSTAIKLGIAIHTLLKQVIEILKPSKFNGVSIKLLKHKLLLFSQILNDLIYSPTMSDGSDSNFEVFNNALAEINYVSYETEFRRKENSDLLLGRKIIL